MVRGSESEDQKLTGQKVNTPEGMFIRDLPEGIKLQLRDQAIVEIVINARDGGWLLARYLESPEAPELIGTEDWVFFGEVIGRVD